MYTIAKKKNIEDEVTFLSKKILDLNKKLMETEKAKSRFLSLIASELNNPMTALLGMIPHLKINDTQDKEIFDIVYNEILKLHFRIQNLLMATKIESGDIDVFKTSLNPEDIIYEVIESLKYLTQERNIKINIINNIKQNIILDPEIIYMIIKNLISNGCKYGISNGVIDVILDKNDSMLIISVRNQGNGPKVEYKAQVFTRFAKDTYGEHGLGLGLSIVRELCEVLDGSITYDVKDGYVTFIAKLSLDESFDELMFDSFDDAIEL